MKEEGIPLTSSFDESLRWEDLKFQFDEKDDTIHQILCLTQYGGGKLNFDKVIDYSYPCRHKEERRIRQIVTKLYHQHAIATVAW